MTYQIQDQHIDLHMKVKEAATRQYQAIVDTAAASIGQLTSLPSEGWLATARKSLGMSAAQLARRLGMSRARISQAERAEPSGGVTLKSMHAIAEAMGCRFIYAIVPAEGRVADIIAAQAHKKARQLVGRASAHMGLENQSLPDEQNEAEVERVASWFTSSMPSNFWADE